MSENRKLVNAIISFVIVVALCWAGLNVITYSQNLEWGQLDTKSSEMIYGNVIGTFLFNLFIFSVVVCFIFKYLISDLVKSKLRIKIQKCLKTFKQ